MRDCAFLLRHSQLGHALLDIAKTATDSEVGQYQLGGTVLAEFLVRYGFFFVAEVILMATVMGASEANQFRHRFLGC